MKKLLSILSMFVATVAFFGGSANTATAGTEKVIDVPGATKAQLLQKVSTWAGRCGNNYTVDEKSGVIVTTEEIAYPSPSIDRFQYSFLYQVKNTIQDNKDTVTFEGLLLKEPKSYIDADVGLDYIGGGVSPVKSKRDVVAANEILNSEATGLRDYLHGAALTCPIHR